MANETTIYLFVLLIMIMGSHWSDTRPVPNIRSMIESDAMSHPYFDCLCHEPRFISRSTICRIEHVIDVADGPPDLSLIVD